MVSADVCDDTGGNNTADCTQHRANQGNCEAQDDGLGGVDAKCAFKHIDQNHKAILDKI